MNIKKIIKEEISDFDWVNKVKPTIHPSDLVGYSITYLGPESWVITDYGEDEGSPYLTVSSPHGVSNIWLSHVIRQVKEGNYTIRDKKGTIIEPQEFRVIKEEIGDFDWAKSTNNPNRMDTSRDYMGVWPDFERMLSELDIPYIEGVVNSDDYEGTAYMRIRTLYFEFDVDIRFDYDEQSIETGTVYWTIEDPNEDSDGRFSGQHSLVSNHWIKPIVDKLREMVEPLVNERKYKPWGHLSESDDFDWVKISDPLSVGMRFKVLGNEYPNQTLARLEIYKIEGDLVYYINKTNSDIGGNISQIPKDRAIRLINDKYWVPSDVYNINNQR